MERDEQPPGESKTTLSESKTTTPSEPATTPDEPTPTTTPSEPTPTPTPPDAPVLEPAPEAAQRRRAVYRLLRVEIFYLLGLAAFAVLAVLAYYNAYFGWDLRASRLVQSADPPGMLALMRFVSFFGNGWTPYLMGTVTGLIFLAFNRRSEMAGLALSAGGSGIVNSLLKMLIARPRPTPDLVQVLRDTKTLSFPSGHVTFYVCYFGFLFFVAYALVPLKSNWRRPVLALAALPVLLVGLSRVYLGAHWPSDTLGAYLVSGLWLAFSLHMYRRWKQRASFKPELHADEKRDVRG
ncbi:MAG TPA: phosphatase PAP2 family protein [Pyrinomonadaceae bacterium]|jgi:undecaprenyl-diphosphatase|nr:phosphatase PAP2 family protein [Pyrinomonadaceae bacterium]